MKIIVPLRPRSFEEFEQKYYQINSRANWIEIWLDHITDPQLFLQQFIQFKLQQSNNVKFLGVCKTIDEKGLFIKNKKQKLELLQNFLQSGGDAIDLDIKKNGQDIIKSIDPHKLFCSFHDFLTVPTNKELQTIYKQMQIINPYVYKFAVTTNTKTELDRFINFSKNSNINKNTKKINIFTTMGKYGSEGRDLISSDNLSWASFFAINNASKTASGQKTLDDL